MTAVMRIPTPLRKATNGQDKVEVEGANVKECVDFLDSQFPGIKERLFDDGGALRNFVNVYVNGEDVRHLQGLDTPVAAGDEISIVPAIAGG